MKLLVLDVEGTLFQTSIKLPGTSLTSTIWQSIAQALGPEAVKEEVQTHSKWKDGQYKNYLAWMEDTIEIHRKHNLTELCFRQLINAAQYNSGVQEVLPAIDRKAFEIVLISGGFRELAARAQKDFLIKHAFTACEYIFGEDGFLRAYNLLPCDFKGKLDFIRVMLDAYGLRDDEWVFVGDGLNDLAIAEKSRYAIGYQPHSRLRKVCHQSIDDFRELLPILAEI